MFFVLVLVFVFVIRIWYWYRLVDGARFAMCTKDCVVVDALNLKVPGEVAFDLRSSHRHE